MDVDEEERVDINSASVEEFVTRLKGVGLSKAKAIVQFRTVIPCDLKMLKYRTLQMLQGLAKLICGVYHAHGVICIC